MVCNDTTRSVSLLELTVCHESNFVEAHQRKVTRYLDLEEEITYAFTTVDVGGKRRLQHVGAHYLEKVSHAVVVATVDRGRGSGSDSQSVTERRRFSFNPLQEEFVQLTSHCTRLFCWLVPN